MSVENNHDFKERASLKPAEVLLDDCGLSIETVGVLEGIGFARLRDVSHYTKDELLKKSPFIDEPMLEELQLAMAKKSLEFRRPNDETEISC